MLVQNAYSIKIGLKILKKELMVETYLPQIAAGLLLYNSFVALMLVLSFELEQLNANTTIVTDEYIYGNPWYKNKRKSSLQSQ